GKLFNHSRPGAGGTTTYFPLLNHSTPCPNVLDLPLTGFLVRFVMKVILALRITEPLIVLPLPKRLLVLGAIPCKALGLF
ncbi:MAG: hypothetical protein WBV51_17830, partial [Pseudolabrys sp.]